MEHKRVEYGLINLLGDVGGCMELLVTAATIILGGYLSFSSSIEIVKSLHGKSQDTEVKDLKKNEIIQEGGDESKGGKVRPIDLSETLELNEKKTDLTFVD